jgi:AcrR family transcriptional regulator
MAERGLRDLRIDDVADRAGVGKATIYRRYRSKNALIHAAVATLVADEPVELGAVRPLDALLELGVDVQGHLGVGVADLAHHPLDVEVVRQQRDRDVGTSQAVGRGGWKRRQAARLQPLGGDRGRLSDDRGDPLTSNASRWSSGSWTYSFAKASVST